MRGFSIISFGSLRNSNSNQRRRTICLPAILDALEQRYLIGARLGLELSGALCLGIMSADAVYADVRGEFEGGIQTDSGDLAGFPGTPSSSPGHSEDIYTKFDFRTF
jgi:hypothetical protein